MELDIYNIYCEVHGGIHEKDTDPYRYGYDESGEEPECGPVDWRNIWVGGLCIKTPLKVSQQRRIIQKSELTVPDEMP